MSLTSTSTTSPSFMFSGSPSVPIQSTSPGYNVRYWLILLMNWRTLKMAAFTSYCTHHAIVEADGDVERVGIEVCHNPWTHRLKRIRILAAPQGPVVALPDALADIVADRVAKHVIQGFSFGDLAALLANDRDQFAFVLHQLRSVLGDNNRLIVGDQGIVGPIPDVRIRGEISALRHAFWLRLSHAHGS